MISALISAAVCAAAHLTIGLTYTYKQLNELYMPLFKLNHLSLFEAHLMRMDKLANVIWLNGAVIAASFSLYAASKLFSKAFGLLDIRPASAASAAIAVLLILFDAVTAGGGFVGSMRDAVFSYGAVAAFPLLAFSLVSAVRSERRKRCENT